ncbi:MAG: hypothetical protein AAGA32_15585 [Pseudomonadota bacterium]
MRLKHLLRDTRGTVTMEFVLTFPLVISWLFLSFTMFDAYRSSSHTSKAVYTIADNLSRKEFLDTTYLEDMYTLLDNLLPFSPDDKWMRMTSVTFDEEEDEYLVDWSYIAKPDGDPTPEHTDETLPLELLPTIQDADSVLLIEVNVPYDPVAATVPFLETLGFDALVWEARSIVRPRFIARVVCTDCA